jgi:NAD(P)-dependent dehydrogenase (short-subunit alcohol dehydrogenase family)
MPGTAAYVAAKHAVVGLTRAAALQYAEAEAGVRVNALVTGTVDTPLLRRLLGAAPSGDPASGDLASGDLPASGLNPLGRLAATGEIAAFAEFLLSDDAAFITGAALPIDGGFTAG